MSRFKNVWKFAGLWALAALAHADESVAPTAVPTPSPTPASNPAPLVDEPERHWRLGIALGYGERTNPLIQSEKIPVLVDLDIAWFGERWFFDNGDVGFELINQPAFTINAVARVNTDRAFFAKTNTRYINFQYLSAGATTAIDAGEVPFKPPKRDYAIEAGVEALFDGDWGGATVHAFQDVSGTHDGYEIGVQYDYRLTRGRFSIAPTVGVEYKSQSLNDYYWGVHKEEANLTLAEYHADAGFGWQAGLRTNYYVSKNLRLALSANYERLQKSVAESPLVKDDYVLGYFGGFAWTF